MERKDNVNHYEVAIESVKWLDEEIQNIHDTFALHSNRRFQRTGRETTFRKLKDIIRTWNTQMETQFPKALEEDIRAILNIRNSIAHDPNYTHIHDPYVFMTRMASAKLGLSLIRKAIERNVSEPFQEALAQNKLSDLEMYVFCQHGYEPPN
eukprot:394974_1